ncbi:MAG: hypothetical protein QG553_290 [Patescibacteria group bacterium]|nr:hypothetical protein [Patescibacteria group bacterium]
MNPLDRYMYRLLLTITFAVLGVGMAFYHFVEKWGWVDAYYFCIVTLTTVGYGDITPKTDAGKLFTTIYILVGIAIFGAFINAFVKKRGQKMQARASARTEKHKR